MSDALGELIKRMRFAATNASFQMNLAKARQAAEQQRLQAWLELLIDRLRSEGISESSPLGVAIISQALADRIEKRGSQSPSDEEGFPRW